MMTLTLINNAVLIIFLPLISTIASNRMSEGSKIAQRTKITQKRTFGNAKRPSL